MLARFHNINFGTNGGTFTYPEPGRLPGRAGSAFTVTLGDIDSDLTQKAVRPLRAGQLQDPLQRDAGAGRPLRPELVSPTETDDRFVYFDAASVSLYQVGPRWSRDKIYGNKNNIQPRVWVSSWDPFKDGRTSVRAAYALLSDQPVTNLVSPDRRQPAAGDAALTSRGAAGSIRLDNALTVAQASGLAPCSVDDSFRNPRLQTWNVNVQRQLRANLSAMVGYFGSKGDYLRIALNQNQITERRPSLPAALRQQPHPARTPRSATSRTIASQGYSRYNGVWVTLNQRIAHGLQFNGSYTWSKSKDTNSLNSTKALAARTAPISPATTRYSDYDARHRYVLNAIWDLPFKGNAARGWLADQSLITQGQTGNPITIVTNQNFTGVGTDPAGPGRQPGGLRAPGAVVLDRRLRPARGRLLHLELGLRAALHERRGPHGQLPRNGVYGPGFYNTGSVAHQEDEDLRDDARVPGRGVQRLQPPEPRLPLAARTAVPGGTAFGVITNTRLPTGDSGSARQIQFAAKLLF